MVAEHAQDSIIFRATGDRLTLVGGSGPGVGWSAVAVSKKRKAWGRAR